LRFEVFIKDEDHGRPCLEHSDGERQIVRRGQQAPSNEIHQGEELQVHRGRTRRIRGQIQETLAKAFYFLQEVFLSIKWV